MDGLPIGASAWASPARRRGTRAIVLVLQFCTAYPHFHSNRSVTKRERGAGPKPRPTRFRSQKLRDVRISQILGGWPPARGSPALSSRYSHAASERLPLCCSRRTPGASQTASVRPICVSGLDRSFRGTLAMDPLYVRVVVSIRR
jgi:hypothetical protein